LHSDNNFGDSHGTIEQHQEPIKWLVRRKNTKLWNFERPFESAALPDSGLARPQARRSHLGNQQGRSGERCGLEAQTAMTGMRPD
jgi:hypothetical protein